MSSWSNKAKVFLALGIYLGITVLLLVLLGNEGKNDHFEPQNEFKLDPWIEINIGGLDLSINKAVFYLLLAAVLTVGTLVWIASRMKREPNKVQIGDGARLRPHPQQHHPRATSPTRSSAAAGSPSSPASSSSSGSRT